MLTQKQIQEFQKELLDWYEKNQRPLPWRQTRNPYNILISEVMSQQTQISRVIPKYLAWIERFPTLQSLAESPVSEVLTYWNGLGYNRRALYLQKLAKELVANYNGEFPTDEKMLRQLPGIGEYTARAILCFAFNHQIAVVDTNIRKVVLVHFGEVISKEVEKGKKELVVIQDIATELLPEGRAYAWNQALMDYASAMLKEHKIPIPKQSHFKTSNRFYRGQLLRMLLQGEETIDSAFEKLENNGISLEMFENIIRQMEKEGMIEIQGRKLRIRR